MNGVSGGAAYRGYQKLDNGISQGLQHWGDIKAKENAAKKLADERDGIRKAKALSDWETKYELKADDFKGKHTGFQSYDDQLFDYGQHAQKKYIEAYRRAKDNYNDPEGRRQAEADLNRFRNDFKRVSGADEIIAKSWSDYQKAVSEGRVSGANGKFDDIMKAVYENKNAAIRYGDNNELRVTGILDNGESFDVPFNNITDGTMSWFEGVDYESDKGLINNLTDKVGSFVKKGIDDNNVVETDLWEDSGKGNIKELIATSLDDKQISDLYNRFFDSDFQYDDDDKPSDKIKDKVINRVFDDVKNNYDQKYSSTLRGLSVSEKQADADKDRNIRRQGQRDTNQRNADNIAFKTWKHNNPHKKNGGNPTEEELDKETNMYVWRIAEEVADLPKEKHTDKEVRKILEREGFKMENDINILNAGDNWYNSSNQVDIGSGENETEDVNQTDKHGIAQALSKTLGVDYDKLAVVNELEQRRKNRNGKKEETVPEKSDTFVGKDGKTIPKL